MDKTTRILPDLTRSANGADIATPQKQPKQESKNLRGETVHYPQGGGHDIDKVQRFGWVILDKQGTFMEVDKRDIKVDQDYQRTRIGLRTKFDMKVVSELDTSEIAGAE